MAMSELGQGKTKAQTVLVVDDEPQILKAIEDLLEDVFDVQGTTDAQSALHLLEEREVAVILSDQRMPKLSGDQFLCEAQRRSQATRLLITGYADMRALVRAVNEGKIYGYVAKPWDPEELRSLVAKAAEYFRLMQELERERNLLHALLDNTPDAIYFKDADFCFTRVNRAQADLLGLRDPGEAVGKSDFDFCDEVAALEAYTDEVSILTSGQSLIDKTEQLEQTGGKARWFSVNKIPITEREGRIVGTIGIARDITERRQLEQRLLQAQKLETLGQLTRGIVHNFNNLGTVVSGYSQLLLRSLAADDDRRVYAEEILKAGGRAEAMTRQLAAFGRLQEMRQEVLDLNAVVADLEKTIQPLLGERITLITVLSPDLGRVYAERWQLEQVIVNLVTNARDAMPKGGTLTIKTALTDWEKEPVLQREELKPGRYVSLAVQDTGIGMDAETQARIFDPFFTTKEIGKGTGLGLPMVYGTVAQSGGCIWVDSRLGQGTTFHIYLPLAREEL